MRVNLEELYDLFYVAAYGCNRRLEREMKDVFYEHHKVPNHLFFEFFTTQPIPKGNFERFEVQYSAFHDEASIPRTGSPSLILIAKVDDSLHFRVFDANGRIVKPDNDHPSEDSAALTRSLKEALANLRPSAEKLPPEQKATFLGYLAPIIGYAPVNSEWGPDWKREVFLLTPFAPRMSQNSSVAPSLDENRQVPVKLCFRGGSEMTSEMRTWALRFNKSKLLQDVYSHWRDSWCHIGTEHPVDGQRIRYIGLSNGGVGETQHVGLLNQWNCGYHEVNPGDLVAQAPVPVTSIPPRYVDGMRDDKLSMYYAAALWHLLRPHFLDNSSGNVLGLVVPIASSQLCYGSIVIWLPSLNGEVRERDGISFKDDDFRKALALRVTKVVNSTYLPVLALLHEHWLETLHGKWLTQNLATHPLAEPFEAELPLGGQPPTAKFRNAYLDLKRDTRVTSTRNIADDFETVFAKLWKRRDARDDWREMDAFKDSLIFKNYLVCSESMIKLLHKVISFARMLRKSGDNIPACLVVGGAGSGKEQLAKMIRLLSDDGYYKGNEFVVNLASIRPAPLTAAIMSGLDKSIIKDFPGVLQGILAEPAAAPPTLRLDEFNSMDPDSQGVLLRFLDNSEIIPLGGFQSQRDKDKVNCLVIGIMNEDPKQLSREQAMEFFRSAYIGGLLSDLMYEHFMRIRRLRPDVIYRMVRNGKFDIPPLAERREDVSLLFHVFVSRELRAHNSSQDPVERLFLPLDVLDRLHEPDLIWPGNIRQLQSLAKVVAQGLAHINDNGPMERIVTLDLLERALEEELLAAPRYRTGARD